MLRTATFAIDGGAILGPFEGYTDGDRWNGWACPLFTREVADRIMAFCKQQGQYVAYDDANDGYTYDLEDGMGDVDDLLLFMGAPHTIDGEAVTLYPIGSEIWTWDEVRDPDPKEVH